MSYENFPFGKILCRLFKKRGGEVLTKSGSCKLLLSNEIGFCPEFFLKKKRKKKESKNSTQPPVFEIIRNKENLKYLLCVSRR
jgi:hypothetical protein